MKHTTRREIADWLSKMETGMAGDKELTVVTKKGTVYGYVTWSYIDQMYELKTLPRHTTEFQFSVSVNVAVYAECIWRVINEKV